MGQKATSSAGTPNAAHRSLAERVAAVIDLIRPAVQADGGDVEFVGLTDDNRAQVRFHGACVGCPSSTLTLQSGILRSLQDRVPEVAGVVLLS
jgi:Fe-S cluster biogenesis protein NfuA